MEHKDKHSGGSFKKVIGLFGGISLVAGMVIGSGVYYLGSTVLERTNMHMGTALLCWIIGGAVSILGGLCFAELGAAMPVAGGMTTYLSKAYGPVFGFINGFCGFLLTASGSIAALAMAAVTAFNGIVPMSDMTIKIIAILIIIFFTALNLRGVRFGSMVQNFSMVVRLIPLVLVIILGLALGNEQPDLSISFNADGSSVGISGAISTIAFATFASLWAYEGWTNLNTVAEEMRNPKRDLPLAIIISVGFITLTYTLFNLAIYKVIPSEEVVSMIESGNLYLGNETINRLMGSAGYWIVLIGMTIGILGTVNGDCLVFPRTYYAMARDGYFPKSFSNIDPKTGVPVEATLASSAMAIILVLFNSLQDLTSLLTFTSAGLNLLTVASVLIFRKKAPDMERPYKVWGGKVTIYITIVLFLVLLINELITNPRNAIIGLLVPLIGVPLYMYFKKKNGGADYTGENAG